LLPRDKKEKYFDCLATFKVGTFAAPFSITGCVVRNVKTFEDEQ